MVVISFPGAVQTNGHFGGCFGPCGDVKTASVMPVRCRPELPFLSYLILMNGDRLERGIIATACLERP